jgi:AP-3 complex subunit delta-1
MPSGSKRAGHGFVILIAAENVILTAYTDLKATALLKLVYLEMFGHDMSWAAFHVLEVMSSQKYLQKRVGYLGAVQSFRPDTEVLMLATNLLKKVGSRLYTP